MKERTLADRLVICVIPETERKTEAGIIIPGISKERPIKGEIMQAGPTCFCKVGETILFSPSAGVQIDLNDGTYVTFRETPDNVYVIL